jgi:parallel beta-helix repeat protein
MTIPSDAGEVILGNVSNAHVVGISFPQGSTSVLIGFSRSVTVEGCTFTGNAYHSVSGIQVEGLRVDRCNASGGAAYLVDLKDYCPDAVFSNNTLANCQGGFHLDFQQDRGLRTLIADNRLNECSQAFWICGNGNRVLRNSINVTQSSHSMIGVYDGSGCIIAGNQLVGGGWAGIDLSNVTGIVVSNNQISNVGGIGIFVWATDNGTFSGNTIRDCVGLGMWLEDPACLDNRIQGNNFIGNNGANSTFVAGHEQAADGGANDWNTDASPHGFGNYWSDWTSPVNGTGIVLSPYLLQGGIDHYPLAAPAPTRPGPPTSVHASYNATSGMAHITWGAPTNMGSSLVLYYQVFRNNVLIEGGVVGNSYNATGLGQGGHFVFEIRAVSLAGAGSGANASVDVPAPASDSAMPIIIVGVVLFGAVVLLLVFFRRK